MKWEYALLVAEYNLEPKDYLGRESIWKASFSLRGSTGRQNIEDSEGDILNVLNRLGREGWEAWQRDGFSHGNGRYSQDSIWLKRPINTGTS